MRKVLSAFFSLACFSLSGVEFIPDLYVKQRQIDEASVVDGKSEATAFVDIQSAIDAAAQGQKILVYPGRYQSGECAAPAGKTWGPSRIAIYNKKLHLKSLGGAGETFIVGSFGSNTNRLGEGALRCVNVYNAAGTIIEGFTLLNGSVTVSEDVADYSNKAGAFLVDGCNRDVAFVECVIDSCTGFSMVAYGASLVRSLITNCHFDQGCAASPQLVSNMVILNSVVYGNSTWKNGDMLAYSTVVNSTLANNKFATAVAGGTAKVYNSVVTAHVDGSRGIPGGYNPIAGAVTVVESSVTDLHEHPLMSSLISDLRVRKGSSAETIGAAKYLSPEYFALTDGVDRYLDYNRNKIAESGVVMAGAIQESCTPAAGAIKVMHGYETTLIQSNFTARINGQPCFRCSYVYPDVYPTQYVYNVVTPKGKRVAAIQRQQTVSNSTRVEWRLASAKDDSFLIMPPPNVDEVQTNINFKVTTQTFYVKPDADAATADGSRDKPFATIQAAVDATTSGAVIYAFPGTYSSGKVRVDGLVCNAEGHTDNEPRTWSRFYVPSSKIIRLISLEGAEKTIIIGEKDVNGDANGFGPEAVRCAATKGMMQISGFTLTGGSSDDRTHGDAPSCGGVLYAASESGVEVSDSIISNNVSRMFALGDNAVYRRCLIKDNYSGFVLGRSVTADACVIDGQSIEGTQIFCDYFRVVNCTVIGDGNGNAGLFMNPKSSTVIANNIFARADSTTSSWSGYIGGTVVWKSTMPQPGEESGYVFANPVFADEAAGDFRMFAHTPARTAGIAPGEYGNAGNWWLFVDTDYNGERWDFAGGKALPGAVQEAYGSCVYVDDEDSSLTIDGGSAGFISQPVTVSANVHHTRPVVGIEINGIASLFNNLAGGKYDVSESEIENGAYIVPIFSNEWFVDDDGDDSNCGFYPNAAKKTLKAALANPNLKSGDVVKALPGVYNKETMIQAGNFTISARAVVPSGVSLVSAEGPAKTIIEGEASDVLDQPIAAMTNPDMHGLGPNAVRCVFLEASASLEGFTIRNGHTRGSYLNSENKYVGSHSDYDYLGGGVAGRGVETCLVSNCVFTACAAFRGGGAWTVSTYNCDFNGNFAIYGGGANSSCRLYNCISRNNLCHPYDSRNGVFYPGRAEGLTVFDSFAEPSSDKVLVVNTLILGKLALGSADVDYTNFHNVAFNVQNFTGKDAAAKAAFLRDAEAKHIIATNLAALAVDDIGRPIIGCNVAVDAGSVERVTNPVGETDFSGAQRIYNGRLDIGAFEADWRGTYAKDISPRNVTVVSASADVVESEAKTVVIPSGESLSAVVSSATGRAGRYRLVVKVDQGARLKIVFNGETLAIIDGDGTEDSLLVDCPEGESDLQFTCLGESGQAEICSVRRLPHTAIFVR